MSSCRNKIKTQCLVWITYTGTLNGLPSPQVYNIILIAILCTIAALLLNYLCILNRLLIKLVCKWRKNIE